MPNERIASLGALKALPIGGAPILPTKHLFESSAACAN